MCGSHSSCWFYPGICIRQDFTSTFSLDPWGMGCPLPRVLPPPLLGMIIRPFNYSAVVAASDLAGERLKRLENQSVVNSLNLAAKGQGSVGGGALGRCIERDVILDASDYKSRA